MPLTTADRLAVIQMLSGHILAFDSGDAATWTSNYTEDAELIATSGAVTRSRAAIGAMAEKSIAGRTSGPDGRSVPDSYHFTMTPRIEGEGDHCTARSYFQILQSSPENGCWAPMTGVYVDECVRVDGRWLIQRRTAQRTLGIHP